MSTRDRVLAWERATRPIAVRPEMVRLTGSFDLAVLLAQILYWCGEDKRGRLRASVVKDGEAWIAKSVDEWAHELGALWPDGRTRVDLIRGMISRLEADGFIVVGKFRFGVAPTLHVRPVWDSLEALTGEVPFPAGSHNRWRRNTVPPKKRAEAGGFRLAPNMGASQSGFRLPANPDSGYEPESYSKEAETTTETTTETTNKEAPMPMDAADDTDNDTAATSAAAPINEEEAPLRLDHWAGGSVAFNALADQIAKWMGKAPEGLHPATAKAIKSGAGRLLAREITAEDISATYGRRWFREHWAGGDRSKTVVDRSPRNLRQIEDWVAQCDATPEPADRVAIDEALAASASASVDVPTQPDPPAAHPWLAEAVAQASARPGSTFERWFAAARLVEIEDGVAVVEVPDEAAAAMLSSRPGALVWPAESGATSTRFVAAGLATQVAA